MTGWHAQILSELFSRTLLYLTGGRPTPPGREQIIERVRAALGPEGSAGSAAGHLAMLSDRYLTATAPERMAAHLRLVHQLDEDPVATELFHHPDLGSSDLVIVTRDQPGLFSLIAGSLASQGVNILSAQIFTRGDGVAIDTFQVNDPFGEAVTEAARWRRVLDVLRRVLRREQTVESLLAARRTGRPLGEGFAGPVKIALDNGVSDSHTVIEVKCPDRVGLLYVITRTLSGLGCDIATARIATEVEQAFDTFYVTDRQGRRIEDPAAIDQIRDALEEALLKPV
jgi:[protein-PII] uridylyltransferase